MVAPLTIQAGEQLGPPVDVIHQVTGVRYNASTVSRWIHDGHKGVRLKVAMIGGKPKTSEAAVLEFVEACTAKAAGPASV